MEKRTTSPTSTIERRNYSIDSFTCSWIVPVLASHRDKILFGGNESHLLNIVVVGHTNINFQYSTLRK